MTTIASSTKTPITSESARRDIILSVKPKSLIPMKEAIRDTGTTTITIRALRTLWRKSRITSDTRRMASRRSVSTELIALRVKVVVSCATSILRPSAA